MNITDFLEARIAEDEAAAGAAMDPARPGSHWQWVTNETDRVVANGDLAEAQEYQKISLRTVEEYPTSAGELPGFLIGYAEEVDPGAGEHIARHDPARVLAECKAKRAIVAHHCEKWGECTTCFEGTSGCGDPDCCGSPTTDMQPWPCPTIRALAAVYADHPDYQQEWSA